MKQIEENATKLMDIPLFDANKFFSKTSNNFIGLNTGSILDKISNPNGFSNDIK